MIYHAERWIDPNAWLPFYSELGLARSMDGGDTWTDLGPIITPHVAIFIRVFSVAAIDI